MKKINPVEIIAEYGEDILNSQGMDMEKDFCQHGGVSVYEHSVSVAVVCVIIGHASPFKVDMKSLVRGALLHDYFLYDWHDSKARKKLHGFKHGLYALENARCDFELEAVEKNMIRSHMFPLTYIVPKYRESLILCMADKVCALKETVTGFAKAASRLCPCF